MNIPGLTKPCNDNVVELGPLSKFPRIEQSLTACVQCGYCIAVCEAHNQTPWESVTPRGKIYYLNQLNTADGLDKALKREVSLNPYFVDAMYKCTGCGNCEVVCHANIHLVEFWETVREWLVYNGVGPMSAHKGMAKKVGEVHNPYGEDPNKRGDWWPADIKKSDAPDTIFFAGCTGSYRQQDIPRMGVRILDRAGVKMNILGKDEWCCSSPLLRTGTKTYSLECAEKVVEKADMMGAKDMVMTCSGCFKTVSSDFGNYYAKVGQNVYHFSQYVEKLINERKLPLNHEFKAKVTYHDPCHLGRHMGVFDAPRNVIKKIKGIELIEMERSRENSRCCGAGGGYKSQYNDFAVNIAMERIKDAEATGAEVLITCCPFCVTNLSQGAKKLGSKIKVMDLSEVLLQVTAPVEEKPKAEPPAEKPVTAPAVATPAAVAKPDTTEKKPAVIEEKPKAEPAPAPAVVINEETDVDEEIYVDDITDYSPEALVRRAAWNKGLRCRKDYGEYSVPVAFVKSRVGVFVNEAGKADENAKKALEEDGWSILAYKISDITDGEAQAVEIRAAIRENLKLLKKKKR